MAYATGTVTGLRALLAALNSFMTANGWTLHDNLGVHDKVYFSSGELEDQHMYIRVSMDVRSLNFTGQTTNYTPGQILTGATSGATAYLVSVVGNGATGTLNLVDIKGAFVSGEAISDPLGGLANASGALRYPEVFYARELENCLDWLNVRHYTFWNAGTHTGVGMSDRVGPLLINGHGTLWADKAASAFRINGKDTSQAPYLFYEPKDLYGTKNAVLTLSASGTSYNGYGVLQQFTGGSTIPMGGAVAGLGLRSWQLGLRTAIKDALLPVQDNNSGGRTIAFVDRTTGAHKVFYWQASAVLASMFWVMDISTGVATNTSSPPFAATAVGVGTSAVWDGLDGIYVAHGSSTAFARYNISSNTWTSLAAFATTLSSSWGSATAYEPLYITAGTIPGVTQDEIWILTNGVAATTLQRYSVTSNTFSPLVVPVTPTTGSLCRFVWDRQRYVYFQTGSFTYAYVLDLQNIGAGWSSVSFTVDPSTQSSNGRFYFNEHACRVRSHTTLPTTYYFVGDADGIAMVTQVNNHKWFSRFGKFNTYRSSATTNVSASLAAGDVTATVESSNGFTVGDAILVVDRANGAVAPSVVSAIPTATSLSFSLPFAMSATSYITVDGANCALFSDHFFAVTSMGVGGIAPDYQPQLYRVALTVTEDDTSLISTTSDARKQLWPFELKWNVPGQANTGKRGTIPNFFLCDGADGEIITDRDGSQYLVLTSDALRMWTGLPTNKIAIGPIN